MRERIRQPQVDRAGVVEAIGRAAKKLGRAPSWGELRRITGVPESRVRVYFASLADAVRAAGVEPGRTGLKIATEELLRDFARVTARLGRSPSRNEYAREGKYSAGAFYARFGSWGAIKESGDRVIGRSGDVKAGARRDGSNSTPGLPTEGTGDAAEHGEGRYSPQMNADDRRLATDQNCTGELTEADKAIAMRWAGAMTALPGELAGKRRVTDAVCAMIVNTLMGEEAGRKWQVLMSGETHRHGENRQNRQRLKIEESSQHSAPECSNQQSAPSIQPLTRVKAGDAVGATGACVRGPGRLARVNGEVTSGGLLDQGRPVMGTPFFPCALTNAPVNELGVVFLFGMLAGELGFQVESLRAGYPDCVARRQIQPGKWQDQRVEVEYESLNFLRHGHDPAKCDVIVCWRHNWTNCPKHIEVIELREMIGGPAGSQ